MSKDKSKREDLLRKQMKAKIIRCRYIDFLLAIKTYMFLLLQQKHDQPRFTVFAQDMILSD